MKVLVVSGFLGAGKTTFIKELIRRTDKFLVILENEYAETDIDSRSLKGSGDIEILEFMEGCVCCTKKDSFINTLLSISASMDPEYLVIEPSGVGKLSSILSNIDKISYEKIQILEPIVILSPRSISDYSRQYPDIYVDQIQNAPKILFSKAEHESGDVLDDAKQKLLDINPNAKILTTHYTLQDGEWWDSLLQTEEDRQRPAPTAAEDDIPQMQQISFGEIRFFNIAELIILLEDLLRNEFGLIPRAKGVVKVGEQFLRFDVADGLYGIIAAEEDAKPQCVFIGRSIDMKHLASRLKTTDTSIDKLRASRKKEITLKGLD